MNGRIGLGLIEKVLVSPMMIPSISAIKISGISVGRIHCLCWDIYGKIYSFGDAYEGKLGHSMNKNSETF